MKTKPDFSIFYTLEYINSLRETASTNEVWGQFLIAEQEIDDSLKNQFIESPYKIADFTSYQNQNPLFNAITKKITTDNTLPNHNRCSAKYYADCFDTIAQHAGTINRIVEVGPHFGDMSCLFAGMMEPMDATLDLVDINPYFLLKTYKKIKELFPEVIGRVRLFVGDLPLYVKKVMSNSPYMHLIHYQGSYNFNDVVRDIGSTYYVKHKIAGTFIHNTHIRTTNMNYYAFIDVAVYSLFGLNVKFLKLGDEASEETNLITSNNPPVYFAKQRTDGMFLPYQHNRFRYPHPDTTIEAFFEKNEIPPIHVE